MSIKKQIRKIVRRSAHLPFVGRLLRIGVHLYRLPEFRQQTIERQALVDSVPDLLKSIDHVQAFTNKVEQQAAQAEQNALNLHHSAHEMSLTTDDILKRFERFESQQIPSIMSAVSDLSMRLQSSDQDKDNVVKSIPVALRRMQRKLGEQNASLSKFRTEIEDAKVVLEHHAERLSGQDSGLEHLKILLDQHARTANAASVALERQTRELDLHGDALSAHDSNFVEISNRLDIRDGEMADRLAELITLKEQLAEIQALALSHAEAVREWPSIRQSIDNFSLSLVDESKRLDLALGVVSKESKLASNRADDFIVALDSIRTELHALANQSTYLNNRVELVRREMMFEMRYGASSARKNSSLDIVESKVISIDKYEAAKANGGLKFNIGCGHVPIEHYLNVDRRELDNVDVVADVTDLPAEEGEVAEIYSAHLLEHFPNEQLKRELMPYWIKLLRPGGAFRAVVPDAQAMIDEYAKGNYEYEKLREVTYGGQDYDGDFHFNMFTPASLAELFQEAGLSGVKIIEKARRNGDCYEFEIIGKKHAS